MDSRNFNSNHLHFIFQELESRKSELIYQGDISDCGNEIGIVVGNLYPNLTEDEISDFIHGIRHGISLTNGSH